MKKIIFLSGMVMGVMLGQVSVNAADIKIDNSVLPTEQVEDAEKGDSEVELYIDNQTVYTGMDTSYSKGYIPNASEDSVVVILPLLSKGEILNKEILVSPHLGETNDSPFVYKNYELYVREREVSIAGTDHNKKMVYYVSLTLELKQQRIGGTFPVTWDISGESVDGLKFQQEFITYVNVDEKKAEEEKPQDGNPETDEMALLDVPQQTENPSEENEENEKKPSPKLLHIGTKCEKEKIIPGDQITFTLQFQNKDVKEDINNVSLTISDEEKGVSVLNESSVWYFNTIRHAETIETPVLVQVPTGIESNAFSLQYKAAYENSDGIQMTEEGTVTVKVHKIPKLTSEISEPDKLLYVGDAIAIKGKFMNTGSGKAYNVTISLDADGVRLQNTMYVGEIDSRNAADVEGILLVDGRKGEDKYGDISGVYRINYSDEQGKEYTEEVPFTTELQPPVILSENEEKDADQEMSVQWWLTVIILVEIVFGCLVYMIKRIKKKHDNFMEV